MPNWSLITMPNWSHLTDEEFLRHIDEKRHQSPVVEAICSRLEAKLVTIPEDANHRVECPVCEAALKADFDSGNAMFELRAEK